MLFLALAAASIFTSNYLNARDIENFGLLTFLGLVVGLVGAMICSVRGLRSWGWFPRE